MNFLCSRVNLDKPLSKATPPISQEKGKWKIFYWKPLGLPSKLGMKFKIMLVCSIIKCHVLLKYLYISLPFSLFLHPLSPLPSPPLQNRFRDGVQEFYRWGYPQFYKKISLQLNKTNECDIDKYIWLQQQKVSMYIFINFFIGFGREFLCITLTRKFSYYIESCNLF